MMNADWLVFWTAVYAIATCILVLGVGAAIWQIIEQRKSAKRSTSAQLTVDFYWKFRDPETTDKLRRIYKLKTDNLNNLSPEQVREIDYVLDWLDTLAFLVREGILDGLLAIEVFGGLIALRCWYRLVNYIKTQRSTRGYFAENFEGFARLSYNFFQKTRIPAKLNNVDLLKELQKDNLRPRTFDEIRKGWTPTEERSQGQP